MSRISELNGTLTISGTAFMRIRCIVDAQLGPLYAAVDIAAVCTSNKYPSDVVTGKLTRDFLYKLCKLRLVNKNGVETSTAIRCIPKEEAMKFILKMTGDSALADAFNEHVCIPAERYAVKHHLMRESAPDTKQTGEASAQQPDVMLFDNPEFGSVRTLSTDDGRVLFCGKDIATVLGYTNTRKALADHCRGVSKRYVPHPQSPYKTIEMTFITEGDVYRLITNSKLPSAEKFESWVFDEVLPAIRRTGSYTVPQQAQPDDSDEVVDDYTVTRILAVTQQFEETIDEQSRIIRILEAQLASAKALIYHLTNLYIAEK